MNTDVPESEINVNLRTIYDLLDDLTLVTGVQYVIRDASEGTFHIFTLHPGVEPCRTLMHGSPSEAEVLKFLQEHLQSNIIEQSRRMAVKRQMLANVLLRQFGMDRLSPQVLLDLDDLANLRGQYHYFTTAPSEDLDGIDYMVWFYDYGTVPLKGSPTLRCPNLTTLEDEIRRMLERTLSEEERDTAETQNLLNRIRTHMETH